MKPSTKLALVFLATVGMGATTIDVSAASLRSPRHGQETVDVSGGPNPAPSSSMEMMHHGDGMPMMGQGGNMEMMQNCHAQMGAHDEMAMSGKTGMGHRSNMHAQMRDKMRQCMGRMNADENDSGSMMMHR